MFTLRPLNNMSKHEVVLGGCRPTPLASYLKALGILRIVAEQKDASAQGHWKEDRFHITSTLDAAELERFIREEYEPTPLLAPWGARSGFYPGSSESSARQALEHIDGAREDPRLSRFAEAIQRVREMLSKHGITAKPGDEGKLDLLRLCRAEFPDAELGWLDACYVLTAEDRRFPQLLGTGGNEGSGSYVSGFAQMVVECIIGRKHDISLNASLFGSPMPAVAGSGAFGQFSPGTTGGPNMGSGFEGGSIIQPWDYLLNFEGTIAFASSATRRLDTVSTGQYAFPFTAEVSPVGVGSLDSTDRNSRAELWLPLWKRPATWREVKVIFQEGRATVGKRVATNGLDFARAVASLGVDKGIVQFQRHAIMERLGQNNLAIPLDRMDVRSNPDADLIAEIDPFLDQVRSYARGKEASATFISLVRRLEDALFSFARDAGPEQVQRVLIRLGALLWSVSTSRKAQDALNRLPLLSSAWVTKGDDGSPEFRIAAALAGLGGRGRDMMPFVLPVQRTKDGWRWEWHPESRTAVWGRGGLVDNLGLIALRRSIESAADNDRSQWFSFKIGASSGDVRAFLAGELDEQRITDLFLGLLLADLPEQLVGEGVRTNLPAAFVAIKPFFVPASLLHRLDRLELLPPDRELALTGELLNTLRAGRVRDAVGVAWRALRAAGYPLVDAKGTPPSNGGLGGPRSLAALMIPMNEKSLESALRMLVARPQTEAEQTP